MRARNFTLDEVEQINVRSSEGVPIAQIAEELGVKYNRVFRILNKGKAKKVTVLKPKKLEDYDVAELLEAIDGYNKALDELKEVISVRIATDEKNLADLKNCVKSRIPLHVVDELQV